MNMEEEVREILKEVLGLDKKTLGSISNNTDLTEYGLDSISAINMIVLIEDIFHITIGEEDLLVEKVSSIEKIQEVIGKYKGL